MNKRLTEDELDRIGKIPMNFVVGKERSGTSLLQFMLNAHPNIIAPPESRFIILLYRRFGRVERWTGKIITDFCNLLFLEGLFRNFWGIDKQELKSVLLDVKERLTFTKACKLIFYLSSTGKENVLMFFDKNPVYYYFLPELNKIFPEARYIHIVRDYRANALSHQKVFMIKNETRIAYRWLKVNMLIEEAKNRSPQNFYTVKYESLVSNPAGHSKEICRFLNLSYDDNMVLNHQSGMYSKFNENSNERFRKIHERVFQSINTSPINEWKEKITPEELKNVEAVAGKYGETAYGYKCLSQGNEIKTSSVVLIIMEIRYQAIKTLCRTIFPHPWLYNKIKRNIRRLF